MSSGALVKVDANSEQLQKALAHWRKQTRDLTPTMQIASEVLVSAVSDEFDTAGRGTWPPLDPKTIAKRRGSAAQILVDTGRFAGSIRGDAGPDWAEAATDVSYSVYHVSDAPRTVIPLRNPFDIPDDRLDEAQEIIMQGIVDQLSKGGSFK